MPFSARKMHFFWQKWQFDPLHSEAQHWCQRTLNFFFQLIFFYLNSEGFFPARSGTWLNPSLNIFNFTKNGPFLKDLRKKVSKIGWNHIYKVYVTQMHHDTRFLTTFLLKNAPILVKICNFLFFKNPHFWLFSGILEVKLKFQDKSYDIFDHNKCPSSEK